MHMLYIVILALLLPSCAWMKRDNKKKEVSVSEKVDAVEAGRIEYCQRSVAKYVASGGTIHGCDSALFAGLLGVACEGVDIVPFEDELNPGKMCRTWDCGCFIPAQDGQPAKDNGAKAGYSKDMNAGVMLNMAVRPVPDLINRIISYLKGSNLVMCEAIDDVTFVSRCIMPPTTYNRWIDIQTKAEGKALHEYALVKTEDSDDAVGVKVGFEAHLAVIGVLTEDQVFGGITDASVNELRSQAQRQPNNALYAGAYALFDDGNLEHAADLWLAQCPLGRLPNNHDDYCTGYRYQRDEDQKDWAVCPDEPFEEHAGVDCAFAAWVISKNR